MALREHEAVGLEYLDLATQLLHRLRSAEPTGGLWEAADLHWWWRRARASDAIGQTFWLDASGPVAAVILTDWGRAWGFDPIVCPDAPDPTLPEVWARALRRIDSLSLDNVEVGVRDDDAEMLRLLEGSGFSSTGEAGGTTWMPASDRPAVPAPPAGFRLLDRTRVPDRPHHLIDRSGEDVAGRLAQSSLYRPDLDLFVEGPDGGTAAYGLFWFDPVTAVGFVEPMRTEDGYQRRGLARLVLASGLARLASLGARRLKVNYEAGNMASQGLYVGSGFRPDSTHCVYARRPGP